MIKAMILAAAALTMGTAADAQTMIQKNDIKVENHLMTPEALWAMGRTVAPKLRLTASRWCTRWVTTV